MSLGCSQGLRVGILPALLLSQLFARGLASGCSAKSWLLPLLLWVRGIVSVWVKMSSRLVSEMQTQACPFPLFLRLCLAKLCAMVSGL